MEINLNFYVGELINSKRRSESSNEGPSNHRDSRWKLIKNNANRSPRMRYRSKKRVSYSNGIRAVRSKEWNHRRPNSQFKLDESNFDRRRDSWYKSRGKDIHQSRNSKNRERSSERYFDRRDDNMRFRCLNRRKSQWRGKDSEGDFFPLAGKRYVRVASYDILYPKDFRPGECSPSRVLFERGSYGNFWPTFSIKSNRTYRNSSDCDSCVFAKDQEKYCTIFRSDVNRGKRVLEYDLLDTLSSNHPIIHKQVVSSKRKAFYESKAMHSTNNHNKVKSKPLTCVSGYRRKPLSNSEHSSFPVRSQNCVINDDNRSSNKEVIILKDVTLEKKIPEHKSPKYVEIIHDDRSRDENDSSSFYNKISSPNPPKKPFEEDEGLPLAEWNLVPYSRRSELNKNGKFSANKSNDSLIDEVGDKSLLCFPVLREISSDWDKDQHKNIPIHESSSGESSSKLQDEESESEISQPIWEISQPMEVSLLFDSDSEFTSINQLEGDTPLYDDHNQNIFPAEKSQFSTTWLDIKSKPPYSEMCKFEFDKEDHWVLHNQTSPNGSLISPLPPTSRDKELDIISSYPKINNFEEFDVQNKTEDQNENIGYVVHFCYYWYIEGIEFSIVRNESIGINSQLNTMNVRSQRGTSFDNLRRRSRVRRQSVSTTVSYKEEKTVQKDRSMSKRRKSYGGSEHTKYGQHFFMNHLKFKNKDRIFKDQGRSGFV